MAGNSESFSVRVRDGKLEDYKDSSEKVNLLSKKMVDQDKKGALAVLIAVAAIVCVFFAIPLIKHMLLLR